MDFGIGTAIVLLIAFMFFKRVVNKLNDIMVRYLEAAEKHAEQLKNSFDEKDK
ncbi:hypothetical protein [Moraxella sp. ZY200743]|uniref:hypothetical protein n=1 Tax=Moraxella sp. ZY200743 TaxID=2911970 RepID=UPI003D7C7540